MTEVLILALLLLSNGCRDLRGGTRLLFSDGSRHVGKCWWYVSTM
jgi:hypothetical protein